MKDLIIIGAGDFGRELSWLIERINMQSKNWNLIGFVDDAFQRQKTVGGYPILGPVKMLEEYAHNVYEVCSIGTGRTRKKVVECVLKNTYVRPATALIDPAAIIGRNIQVEEGCVICAGSVLTVDVKISHHSIINLNCTVGHDTLTEPFCTVHPGTNLSGKVRIGSCTDIGTGTKVIQGISICSNCTLGAGSVVVRDIQEPGTYVGVPAGRIS